MVASVHESNALERRHELPDARGELDLERARGAEAGALPRRRRERADQAPRGVAMNQRTP